MNTKSIPAIIMLLAGFIACLAGMKGHMEVSDFMIMLLIVLIIFYMFGCVIKAIVDKNFVMTEETTDGENSKEDDLEFEENETLEEDDEE